MRGKKLQRSKRGFALLLLQLLCLVAMLEHLYYDSVKVLLYIFNQILKVLIPTLKLMTI